MHQKSVELPLRRSFSNIHERGQAREKHKKARRMEERQASLWKYTGISYTWHHRYIRYCTILEQSCFSCWSNPKNLPLSPWSGQKIRLRKHLPDHRRRVPFFQTALSAPSRTASPDPACRRSLWRQERPVFCRELFDKGFVLHHLKNPAFKLLIRHHVGCHLFLSKECICQNPYSSFY